MFFSPVRTVLFVLLMGFGSCLWASEKLSVSFINPGRSNEAYWVMFSSFMEAVARDFEVELEVLYSERDPARMNRLAADIAKRSSKPDYVVLVNEWLAAPELIKMLDEAQIKTFLVANDLTVGQKAVHGEPRKKYKNWIGTLTPDNVDAGYKIARSLFLEARRLGMESPEAMAISGNRETPASADRRAGLDKALAEFRSDNIRLVKEAWAEFDELKAYEQTKLALERLPNLKIIWAANDPMAMGAMRAVREQGKVPGQEILFGGLNWSSPALRAISKGEMVASVGGHFMCGGWSLIAIYDYAKGHDFAPTNGIEMKPEVFGVLDAANVETYLRKYNYGDGNWSKVDFARFSRTKNPEMKKYDFSLKALMDNTRM